MANKFGRGGILNLTGVKTSNFTIIERLVNRVSVKTKKEFVQWKCLCKCGKEFIMTTKQFNRGQKSCGCLKSIKGKYKYSDEESVARKIYSHYRVAAKRRNLNWDLPVEEFIKLLFKNCYYCGSSPSRVCENFLKNCKTVVVTGVDRKDSNLGYSINNCVPCCKTCNFAKGDLTEQKFQEWINQLVKFKNENNSPQR